MQKRGWWHEWQETNCNRCKVWTCKAVLFRLLLPEISWFLQTESNLFEAVVWYFAEFPGQQKESAFGWLATSTIVTANQERFSCLLNGHWVTTTKSKSWQVHTMIPCQQYSPRVCETASKKSMPMTCDLFILTSSPAHASKQVMGQWICGHWKMGTTITLLHPQKELQQGLVVIVSRQEQRYWRTMVKWIFQTYFTVQRTYKPCHCATKMV